MERRNPLLTFFLIFLAPFAIASVYLYLSRWPERSFTTETDWLALATAMGVGVWGLILLPFAKWQKALLVLLYGAAMGFSLVIFALAFVCGAFGDCL